MTLHPVDFLSVYKVAGDLAILEDVQIEQYSTNDNSSLVSKSFHHESGNTFRKCPQRNLTV